MGLGLAQKLAAQKNNKIKTTEKKISIDNNSISVKQENKIMKKDNKKVNNSIVSKIEKKKELYKELILDANDFIKTQKIEITNDKKPTSIKIKQSLFDAFTKFADAKKRSKNEIFNNYFVKILKNNFIDNKNNDFIQSHLMDLKFSSEVRSKVQTYYICSKDLKMIDSICESYNLSRPDLLELCILSLIKK